MRKIIKRKIHISTHKRDLIDFINDEFYSHDKHNAFIEFTMKSLPTDNIIALFYFQKTKRYVETKAFVDGDKFTIEFDTSLINTDETVLGFIYFEKVAQSADVHRFSFGVRVSEIDKLHDIPIEEAKTKRVVAIEDIVTKTELDELFKRIEKNGGTYNDTEIRNSISSISERVQTLENKPDNDTRYDDSDVKSRLSALESNSSRYLTEHQPLTSVEERIQQVEARFNNLSNIYLSSHQSLEHLATKVALSTVEQRVEQLEQNRSIDSSIENRLTALENKPIVDITEFAKKNEIPTIDSVNNLLRTQGEQATKLSALEAKSAYEIHGTGMPNGRVTAPIGTTYVDTAVTNGALKWIKESGDGNTGWKVLIGDTGWRTLNIVSKLNTASLQIRRVNNAVTYNFGGLSWGWFGIVRRNGQGYVGQGTDFERNCFILTEHSVPVGFRTPNSLIGPIYNDRGVAYGTWYIGNPSDNNHLRFQFLNPIPTDQDIGDIRVSTISYYTDDEWPTTLP